MSQDPKPAGRSFSPLVAYVDEAGSMKLNPPPTYAQAVGRAVALALADDVISQGERASVVPKSVLRSVTA